MWILTLGGGSAAVMLAELRREGKDHENRHPPPFPLPRQWPGGPESLRLQGIRPLRHPQAGGRYPDVRGLENAWGSCGELRWRNEKEV